MIVLWRPAGARPDAFRRSVLERSAAALEQVGPARLVANVADVEGGARPRPRADGAVLAGLVSVVVDRPDDALRCAQILDPSGAGAAVYRVREAVPLSRGPCTWPAGRRTPGVKQVTLLRRKPGLDDAEFERRWFEVHTPLALSVHPLWDYNRNSVEQALSEGAPPYEGIVELAFRRVEDLLDPGRFFGGPGNARRIVDDVARWLDLPALEVCAMSEIVLRGA